MRTARAWSARTAPSARAARSTLTTLALAVLAGCGSPDAAPGTADAPAAGEITLGPKDGRDLPAVDLDRVKVGDAAPDFSLESYAGPVVTLSDFRGKKNVVLVFYRGYW